MNSVVTEQNFAIHIVFISLNILTDWQACTLQLEDCIKLSPHSLVIVVRKNENVSIPKLSSLLFHGIWNIQMKYNFISIRTYLAFDRVYLGGLADPHTMISRVVGSCDSHSTHVWYNVSDASAIDSLLSANLIHHQSETPQIESEETIIFLDNPSPPTSTTEHVLRHPIFKIACGGTFDCIHNGHYHLLTCVSYLAGIHSTSYEVSVGITDDSSKLVSRKELSEKIGSFEYRKILVENYLNIILGNPRIRIARLGDVIDHEHGRYDWMGPPGVESDYSALVVSNETLNGGRRINGRRRELGLTPVVVYVLERKDEGNLSSTALRQRNK